MKKIKKFIDKVLPAILCWLWVITALAASIGLCIITMRWLLGLVGVI